MALTLYSHPLASFCHKVLIALYENDTPFVHHVVNLADPASSAPLLDAWPVGKIPVLDDAARGRIVPETTIIIEHLDTHHRGARRMIPADADDALQARLWDRFMDNYVHVPMQKIVVDRLRPPGSEDPHGVAEARATLRTAYTMLERQLKDTGWLVGNGAVGDPAVDDTFGLADCAAAPALFYAHTLEPFGSCTKLAAYFDRLCARPSFQRVLVEARPYFKNYPYYSAIPQRFLG